MSEQYRKMILGGLIFITIEMLLIIAFFVNLLKRRRAEAEIAVSSLRYRMVADYTYDWEYWSAPDGALSYVSPSCKRITGYSVLEFIDDPSLFIEIIVPEDRKTWDGHVPGSNGFYGSASGCNVCCEMIYEFSGSGMTEMSSRDFSEPLPRSFFNS
jgi:PAS domain-containing protein